MPICYKQQARGFRISRRPPEFRRLLQLLPSATFRLVTGKISDPHPKAFTPAPTLNFKMVATISFKLFLFAREKGCVVKFVFKSFIVSTRIRKVS